ncbi:hypothetical protein FRC03_011498 [Tulasnella sp. 419]|nr:hypothetical protein FRC03_011498 [Tulasnella sp. 419]
MHFSSFVSQSVSIAVRVASKFLPERITDYIGTLATNAQPSSSRSSPPRFYSSLYDDRCSYNPAQDPYIRAFYGDSYLSSSNQLDTPQFTSSSQRAEMIFDELLPAPPKRVSISAGRTSSKNAARKNAQLLQAKKREAIRLCANPTHFLALLDSNIPRKEKITVFRLAKTAIKEKFFSKRFSDKPFSKNHADKIAELGEISTLPALERFSTSLGLHGATLLGKGVRMDGLSYGRRRGVSGKPDRVPAVLPMTKQVTEVASEYQIQHLKVMPAVSTRLPVGYMAPRVTQKPRLVVRTGREDWGRKCE